MLLRLDSHWVALDQSFHVVCAKMLINRLIKMFVFTPLIKNLKTNGAETCYYDNLAAFPVI